MVKRRVKIAPSRCRLKYASEENDAHSAPNLILMNLETNRYTFQINATLNQTLKRKYFREPLNMLRNICAKIDTEPNFVLNSEQTYMKIGDCFHQ